MAPSCRALPVSYTHLDVYKRQYSVGVVLYEMLTGQVPFDSESAVSIAIKHIGETPRSIRELKPELPRALEQILQKALSKDPAEMCIRDRGEHGQDHQRFRDAHLNLPIAGHRNGQREHRIKRGDDRRARKHAKSSVCLLYTSRCV